MSCVKGSIFLSLDYKTIFSLEHSLFQVEIHFHALLSTPQNDAIVAFIGCHVMKGVRLFRNRQAHFLQPIPPTGAFSPCHV
jgi:hypothetical protein